MNKKTSVKDPGYDMVFERLEQPREQESQS